MTTATILLIYFFILGIIIGSFLNVVVLRYKTGKTLYGRSSCMSCKTQLTWRELVPILSFLFQKGKCKSCKTRLDIQYPLVELSTGILFALNFWMWLNTASSVFELIFSFVLTTFILILYIVIFVYDLKHKIIPDIFSLTAWGASIVFIGVNSLFIGHSLVGGNSTWIPAFAGMTQPTFMGMMQSIIKIPLQNIFAGILFYAIIWAIWRISKGRMIGLGDAKLLLSIGTVLGFVYGLSAIFVSVWIATLYVIYIVLKQYLSKRGKHITMKTEIPFGPFLIIGFLIVYFTHIDVTNLSMILENFS